jgi:hypothetical protein
VALLPHRVRLPHPGLELRVDLLRMVNPEAVQVVPRSEKVVTSKKRGSSILRARTK